ncbi:substrate-binding domain-containing protein [Paenibacillus sacheonensis]|uniref:Substrate-binding domain-containing protein n=1 Tax=Paenibacillus sacheonensis TaxID=742054 RepID=A0A7X5C0T8_9BACL|nr:DNA-binding LacI/PurR family transcriptional regulator [Paenibacillus sacheonensis]NBC68719.1 substrate-binding domain-containing protein [Paenibacillus sacheonensis]
MTDHKPRYQMIIDYYKEHVAAGLLKAGDKLPNGPEIAQQFGVSAITVTHAMRQLETMGYVKRIKKAGTFVTEPPSGKPGDSAKAAGYGTLPADPTRGGASAIASAAPLPIPVISLVMPFNENIGYEMFRGVEEECAERGFYVTFHNSRYDDAVERAIIQKLAKDRVSGIIVYPVSSYKNIDVFGSLAIDGIPYALIDRSVDGLDAPLVISDNTAAGRSIASHLIGLGHRQLAFVCPIWNEAVSISDRYKGYCSALIEAGIAPKPEWLITLEAGHGQGQGQPSDSSDGSGQRNEVQDAEVLLERLLTVDPPPTAAVVVNDYSAANLLKAALQRGIGVPGCLSITGFDNLSFTSHLEVPLTTVEQDFYGIGREAARLVLAPAEERAGAKIVLPTKLVDRESSGAPQQV